MPIKPENKKRYPKNWQEIRKKILLRADYRCEGSPKYPDCRAVIYQPHPITGSRVVLTIAHLDHTPENCDEANLRAWCQRCHLTYDAKEHAKNAKATRNAKKKEKTMAKTKEQEMIEREQIDESQKQTVIKNFEKKLEKVSAALTCTNDPCWHAGFISRSKRRDDAVKQMRAFLKIDPWELQGKEDLKEFNKSVKALKDAIEDVDEHTRDQKGAVEELNEFIKHYEEASIFHQYLNKNAQYDLKTAKIKIVKVR